MFIFVVTVTLALAAAMAVVAAARYRLPVEFIPAVAVLAVFAGTVPAWADGVPGRSWPAAVCLLSAAAMLLAAGWAWRTRVAQLRPGWGRLLRRETVAEAEAAAEDRD